MSTIPRGPSLADFRKKRARSSEEVTTAEHGTDLKKHDARLNEVEKKLDENDQKERSNNIILTGVPAGKDIVQKSVELLRSKAKVVLSKGDIKYGIRLGEKDGGAHKDKRPERLVFNELSTRNNIYKSRTKLQGSTVWMSEYLTPRKGELAYKARELVRQKKAIQTWTFGGTIFVKTS
jgi:hypothetical protein